uniref:histone deacetylase n=1 Tax=Odontella aurita TaxID=265563 RepID=A0A7S4IKF4_9STRA|mmetsp:Transcript_26438/g.78205  ORF Transcript_26438/g.78205 Transcript_26438/m.78205 type:complete len:1627 (+) Transcript_26438:220-5100(+)
MTSSLPQSPLSSPGISDQDIEVLSPLNPSAEREIETQVGDSNKPIALDVENDELSTAAIALLQNGESPKPQDENNAETKGTVNGDRDQAVIDLAASSDDDVSKKDHLPSSVEASGVGGGSRTYLDGAGSGLEDTAEPLRQETFATEGQVQENDAATSSSTVATLPVAPDSIAPEPESIQNQNPEKPDLVYRRADVIFVHASTITTVPIIEAPNSDVNTDEAHNQSVRDLSNSLARDTEISDTSPVLLGELETTRARSDSSAPAKDVEALNVPDAIKPTANAETHSSLNTTEVTITEVENGGMDIHVASTTSGTSKPDPPTGGTTEADAICGKNSTMTGDDKTSEKSNPPALSGIVETAQMDVDPDRFEPNNPVKCTGTGVAEKNAEMAVDNEIVVPPPDLSGDVQLGADESPQAKPISEAAASTGISVKRKSPSQADEPPAKKSKEDLLLPQSDNADKTSLQPDSSKVFACSKMQQNVNDPVSNPDVAKSIAAPDEANRPPSMTESSNENKIHPLCDPFFASIVNLSPIPDVKPLPLLSPRDIAELESALQIGDKYSHNDDNQWKDDWSGNLQLLDKELLMNRGQIAKDPQTRPVLLPFVEWVAKTTKSPQGFRGVQLLFSYVYHMQGTPAMAQKIMAHSLQRRAKTVNERLKYILDGIRRITYDPTVLTQDGWTTGKAESPDGVSGGAFLIGRRVIWHRYEAIVIAFVRDDEIGDLWKAIWLEDHDTFDLEADELQEALKKWDRREQVKQKKLASRQTLLGGNVKPQGFAGKEKSQSSSMRFAASSNLTCKGIEHGIILATSFNQQARLGVPWPARVMNVSEVKANGAQASNRRSSSKNLIHIVFLAPYWNGQYSFSAKKSGPVRNKAATAKDPFSTGPLFEMDTIEVSESTIRKYPFDADVDTLSIDMLRTNFRFLGLPQLAFNRYLAAHRLALSFKSYAMKEMSKKSAPNNQAQGALSALTDAHPLSVQAYLFPQASLDLPFDYILSKLPCPVQQAAQLDDSEETKEPVINLQAILKAMSPPRCFGLEASGAEKDGRIPETPESERGLTPVTSPAPRFPSSTPATGDKQRDDDESLWSVSNFASDYLLKVIRIGAGNEEAKLPYLGRHFAELVSIMRQEIEGMKGLKPGERKERVGAFLKQCLIIKGHGEDILYSNIALDGLNRKNVVLEWRKACERVYKWTSVKYSSPGIGNGVTSVITDSRCNQHITASGSFERAVRLPAAIKGARKAGAGKKETIPLLYTVDQKYMELAEEEIIPKAHKASYLKRLKAKIANLPADAKGMPLTDDSEGEGGEDTMGSRGSYTAAVLGVAAALQGVDMIVGGQCVNVFCAIRPPGHHAGRELRPMHAISNGFCLLNAAACAALYATAPQAEGGLGLKRVCIIDFDVHHGNGTQDILCSTHDSRFLYVSLHAGGAHINGYDDQGDAQDGHTVLGGGKNEGIFPGRCGDTSPHEGVLNIPLGSKVTAAAVGNALVTQVSPAVDKFCPELIVLSAGFDAHKHDPLGMGGLSAEDFGSVTEVACQMAFKTCSGRIISVLEGGYGVPCCRPPNDLFLPDDMKHPSIAPKVTAPVKLLDLGDDLPDSMEDPVTPHLQQKLERCHQEGFMDCVQAHVGSLSKCSKHGK